MAPVRTHVPPRRRSSVATLAALSSIKSGTYYPQPPQPQQRPVTFAPNVTPSSYLEEAEDDDEEAIATLFPPAEGSHSDDGAGSSSADPKKRVGGNGSRRRSVGHIPRPPNAFMLFRADFVRMKHVPGSVETTHGSLSKIIGNCWRQLPLEEKRVWEIKAKHAKAEHKARYPGYRFRPVHNKAKRAERAAAAAAKPPTSPEEDYRCEAVAALLLQGKKGQELTDAVRALDVELPPPSAAVTPSSAPSFEWPQQQQQQNGLAVPNSYAALRRPSSVPPLPTHGMGFPASAVGGIAIPSLPFLHPFSRPDSPSSASRSVLGSRRTSSVPPQLGASMRMMNSWGYAPEPMPAFANEALPEMNTALFEPSFFDASFSAAPSQTGFFANPFGAHSSPSAVPAPTDVSGLSPLDPLAGGSAQAMSHAYGVSFDPSTFAFSHSQPPASTYSASPTPSETSLNSASQQQQQQQQVFAEPALPTLAAPMPLRAPSFAAFDQEHVLYGAPSSAMQGLPEGMVMMPGQEMVFDLGDSAAGLFAGLPPKFSPAPEFMGAHGQAQQSQPQYGFNTWA